MLLFLKLSLTRFMHNILMPSATAVAVPAAVAAAVAAVLTAITQSRQVLLPHPLLLPVQAPQ